MTADCSPAVKWARVWQRRKQKRQHPILYIIEEQIPGGKSSGNLLFAYIVTRLCGVAFFGVDKTDGFSLDELYRETMALDGIGVGAHEFGQFFQTRGGLLVAPDIN